MMYRRRLFPLLIVGFLGIFILGGIRSSAFRSGYYRGYNAAQIQAERSAPPAVDGVESPNVNPESNQFDSRRGDSREFRGDGDFNREYRGERGHGHHHGFGIFGLIGGLFRLVFTILFIGFIFKLITRRGWGGRRWNSEWRQEMRNKFDNAMDSMTGTQGNNTTSTTGSNEKSAGSDSYTEM